MEKDVNKALEVTIQSQWRKLVHAHSPALYRAVRFYFQGLYRKDIEPKDILQEVFLTASRIAAEKGLPSNAMETKFWLMTILRNHLNNLRRSNRRSKNFKIKHQIEQENLEDGVYQSSLLHERLSKRKILETLIAGLNGQEQEILFLADYEGYNSKEIGQALTIPQGTVRSRLHNIKKKLKKEWMQQEIILGDYDLVHCSVQSALNCSTKNEEEK